MPKTGGGSFSTCFTIDALIGGGSGTASTASSSSSSSSCERLRWWSGLGLAAAAAVQHLHGAHQLPITTPQPHLVARTPPLVSPSVDHRRGVDLGTDEVRQHAFRAYRRLHSTDDVVADKSRFLMTPQSALSAVFPFSISGDGVPLTVTPEADLSRYRHPETSPIDSRGAHTLSPSQLHQSSFHRLPESNFRFAADGDGVFDIGIRSRRVHPQLCSRMDDVITKTHSERPDTAGVSVGDVVTSASSLFLLQQSTGEKIGYFFCLLFSYTKEGLEKLEQQAFYIKRLLNE